MTEIWQSYKKLPCWKKILLAFPMLIAFVGIGCMWLYRESHFSGNRLEQSRDAMEFLYETGDKRMEHLALERDELVEQKEKTNGHIREINTDMLVVSNSIDGATSVREIMGIHRRLTEMARRRKADTKS